MDLFIEDDFTTHFMENDKKSISLKFQELHCKRAQEFIENVEKHPQGCSFE